MSQPKVLVAYASRYGSTGEVAERIATRLRERGARVDLRRVAEIENVDAYDAVVLGSPVFDGSWMPEAADTARRLSVRMSARPVWLFSVGTFGDRHPLIGGLVKREPREIHELADAVNPRDYRVFAGVIDPERWSRLGGIVLRALGGRCGDNRNWPGIEAWAGEIARSLGEP